MDAGLSTDAGPNINADASMDADMDPMTTLLTNNFNECLEALCNCKCQWISTGWTCTSCYNTGSAWYHF